MRTRADQSAPTVFPGMSECSTKSFVTTTAHFAIAEECAYNGAGYTFTQYKIATGEVIGQVPLAQAEGLASTPEGVTL
jgi:hypothetical protein